MPPQRASSSPCLAHIHTGSDAVWRLALFTLLRFAQKRFPLMHPGLKRYAIIAALAGATALIPIATQAGTAPFALSAEDQSSITRIERYMTALRTLQAQFVQTSVQGYATGKLYMQRPGLLRFDYDRPLPHQIIADGRFLFFWDAEVKGVSQTALNNTLVDLIVRQRASLSDGVTLVALDQSANILAATLVSDAEPDMGSLSLLFSQSPFQLIGWRTLDAQGTATEVRLTDLKVGQPLDRELFYFYPPD